MENAKANIKNAEANIGNATNRTVWIDYLRAFITVLVVAHHAALAYTTFATFNKEHYIWSTSPVVDEKRSVVFDVFVNFNDVFFMQLMFFISGLFVYKAIERKGAKAFLKERLKRLGIPFIIGVCIIIPTAYIPSYFLAGNPVNFVHDYLYNQQWPVGPPWFIWLLLAFNILALLIPQSVYKAVSGFINKPGTPPIRSIGVIFLLICIAYIPLTNQIGAYTWTGWGPFDFQLNRVLLYFLAFFVGVCLGSGDWLVRFQPGRPVIPIAIALLTFGLLEWFVYHPPAAPMLMHFLFAASCLASSVAFVAFFAARIKSQQKVWNNLAANAYGIYLVHYVFVTWLQWALLKTDLPVMVKFFIVFIATLTASWLIINWIRRIKVVRTVL